MSSRKFSTELTPEPALCRLLLAAGALALALGACIIAGLPVAVPLRAVAAVLWCLLAGRDLASLAATLGSFSKLRIDADGAALLLAGDGRWQAATLGRGSVVLPRLAWLRLRLADGRSYRALLRGNGRESEQWRRLQVIWRQLGSDARSC